MCGELLKQAWLTSLRCHAELRPFLDLCAHLGEARRQVNACELRIVNSDMCSETLSKFKELENLAWMTWPSCATRPWRNVGQDSSTLRVQAHEFSAGSIERKDSARNMDPLNKTINSWSSKASHHEQTQAASTSNCNLEGMDDKLLVGRTSRPVCFPQVLGSRAPNQSQDLDLLRMEQEKCSFNIFHCNLDEQRRLPVFQVQSDYVNDFDHLRADSDVRQVACDLNGQLCGRYGRRNACRQHWVHVTRALALFQGTVHLLYNCSAQFPLYWVDLGYDRRRRY